MIGVLMMNLRVLLMVSPVVLALTACSSAPSVGDRMLSQGQGTQQLGEQWKKGQDLIKKGEKLKAKGQEQVEDGQDDIKDGTEMIEKGQKMIAESEKTYNEKFPAAPATTPSN
jgi:uncharacterized membrane-anchored protein